jgi:beta-glucosidase
MSYRDAALPISSRIADLLGQMTLDEKLAQINCHWMRELLEDPHTLSTAKMQQLLSLGIGQITRSAGSSVFDPISGARANNALQRFLVTETRLGIPAIIHEECCSGYMGLGGTTYPVPIGLAGTFQPDLVEEMTTAIRTQMRSVGAHQGLAPVLDVARDPRWGRMEETFGEDPTLISRFGVAYVRGLQGESLKNGGVMATGKHFVGYALSQGGMNCAPVHMGEREMWEVFLLPFQAVIRDAGLHTIMNAYPELDGELVGASRAILTDLLRGKLGFNGLVTSDYETILMIHNYHRVAPDLSSAAVKALTAGIDVELPNPAGYLAPLKQAVEAGMVSMELVDQAVSRHLQKKFQLGLFENPYVDESRVVEVFETPSQRSLARRLAEKSMTLLTNDGILPLKSSLRKLAVIGPNADSGRSLIGAYSYQAQVEYMLFITPAVPPFGGFSAGSLETQAIQIPTILQAIRTVAPGIDVRYARGCENLDPDRSGFEEAIRIAKDSDAVILVLGDLSGLKPDCTAGETRDSADLRLPGVQNELAEAVFATGKPVVVVLVNGRPLAIPELAEKASAILEAWLPGEEGAQAVAATLFGKTNPAGRLPSTFPRHVGQVPIFYNQKPSGGRSNWYFDYVNVDCSPLFPFGHGLSYTSFEYSGFTLSTTRTQAGGSVDVSVQIRNTGPMAGDEVVQLYICDEYGCVPRPVKEMKGFVRLTLQPGESHKVTFRLPVDQLAFYDEAMNLVVEAGTIKVMVGASSADIRCEGSFVISGEQKAPVSNRLYHCPVEID